MKKKTKFQSYLSALIDYEMLNYGHGCYTNNGPTTMISSTNNLELLINHHQYPSHQQSSTVIGSSGSATTMVGSGDIDGYSMSNKSTENTKRFSVNNLLQLPSSVVCGNGSASVGGGECDPLNIRSFRFRFDLFKKTERHANAFN